jgi:hypothetical protein
VDTVPIFKLRGSRLVDAEPVLLGLVVGSGSNWPEGWYRLDEWLPAESFTRRSRWSWKQGPVAGTHGLPHPLPVGVGRWEGDCWVRSYRSG